MTEEQLQQAAEAAVPELLNKSLMDIKREYWIKGVKSDTAREHHRQEWIPVTERLPENGKMVLIYFDFKGAPFVSNCIMVHYFNEYAAKFDVANSHYITHWQPIPKAPTPHTPQ